MAILVRKPQYSMIHRNSLILCECCGEEIQEYQVTGDGQASINVCEDCSYLFFSGDRDELKLLIEKGPP